MNTQSRMLVAVALLTGSIFLSSCARHETPPAVAAQEDALQLLTSWMNGRFSSREQSLTDPSFMNIQLNMAPIWTERADGPWLYVEQARADTPDRPYRQRIYRLVGPSGDDRRYACEVYTLPEPVSQFTGAWNDPQRAAFRPVAPAQLKKLEGCTVRLAWSADRRMFIGGTEGQGCASTRDGAAYMTSEISLADGLLTSWDRGFAANGARAWGPAAGGYRFVRQP